MELPGGRLNLGRLVSEQYECLYRYAFRLCGRAQDAEDLTQEAFCKAQLNSGQLREADRAKPWLFRILRNLFLQKIRGEKGRH